MFNIITYIKSIIAKPLEVTLQRNEKAIKEYGSLESLLRSVLLPVESKKTIKILLRDFFLILLPVLTLCVVPMTVISGSMSPTMLTGDSLLASNIFYGGKWTSMFWNKYYHSNASLFRFAKPQKGHIVVFRNEADMDKVFVKRIIGEPGDTVQFKNKILYINNLAVKLEFKHNNYYLTERGKTTGPYKLFEETLPNGIKYNVIWSNDSLHRNTPKYVIPKGCFMVIGDNRDNSADSRSMLGFVEEKHIMGRVMFVWAHHQYGLFSTLFGDFRLWIKGFNFSRFFLQVK